MDSDVGIVIGIFVLCVFLGLFFAALSLDKGDDKDLRW